MTAYELEPWHDLFVMAGGASAALAGLIFVAVSLNLELVLGLRSLPALAGQSISMLIGVVVLSAFGLAPGQGRLAFGIEVLVLAVVLAAIVLRLAVTGLPDIDQRAWRLQRVIVAAGAVLPGVAAGLSLITGVGGGMWWVLAAVVVTIVIGVFNAWVLLIEIRR